MKYLIVAVALFAFVAVASAEDLIKLTDEQKAKAHERAVECIAQEGVDKEAALALRQGNFANADAKVKCFANCFLEKTGFFVNGEIKEDTILTKLGPIVGESTVKDIFGKCNQIKGDDKCDTAFKLYECYYTNKAAI